MRFLRALLVVAVVFGAAVVVLRLAFPLPDRAGVEDVEAIAPSEDTPLGAAILPALAAKPGLSGVIPLAGGAEAFAARVLMARAAQKSLDVQYYIWQSDTTGAILLDELRTAAERGVRVRLLLDDNGIPGLDSVLASLDALPNFEVRIFNPFTLRSPKLVSYAFDFFRLNHRMHNKSFTADGVATVVGGRNVGDIYFAFGPDVHYIDTDVLAIGQAAADVSATFDDYWNSASAYPAALILPPPTDGLDQLAAAAGAARASEGAGPYLQAILDSPLVRQVEEGLDTVEWTNVTLVADDPAKGLGQAENNELLVARLGAIMADPETRPETSVDLISAYFVPGQIGTDMLTGMAANGIDVRVLTNAQEATDVITVHGSYAEYRPDLLAGGVGIYELKADPLLPPQGQDTLGIIGSSASSLHSKVFAIDGERVFIGSFNFDPRSAQLNTEMGLLIESPAIARAVSAAMDHVGDADAYQVMLTGNQKLEWLTTTEDGTQEILRTEPNTTWFSRLIVKIIGVLPVEWMM